MRKDYGQFKHAPTSPPSHVLREPDLRDMASKGILKDQHFLIQILAKNMGIVDVLPPNQ